MSASSQQPIEERVPDSSVTDVGNQTSSGSGEVVVSDDLADLSSHSNSVSPQELRMLAGFEDNAEQQEASPASPNPHDEFSDSSHQADDSSPDSMQRDAVARHAEETEPVSSDSGQSINLVQQRGPFDHNYEAPAPQVPPAQPIQCQCGVTPISCRTPATELCTECGHDICPFHFRSFEYDHIERTDLNRELIGINRRYCDCCLLDGGLRFAGPNDRSVRQRVRLHQEMLRTTDFPNGPPREPRVPLTVEAKAATAKACMERLANAGLLPAGSQADVEVEPSSSATFGTRPNPRHDATRLQQS